ncbi:uroporphyrinogen-III synthase [Agrobacterium larrymoorei]|uniref:uroporphyrinogen-III synthase n=1 Tax=Agrobacterium larrymoorei TaxID=160699 RepID=UPI00157308CA|nr:uroporphyrinogen-III synthase [Agrobacterium larrymoorei]NTJ43300.1 uroporphyrinogen-III synthase [Agrobacterium larrymoorei]
MRVVVTRPESSGKKTAALLRERGHKAILLPLTQPLHKAEAAANALSVHPAFIAMTSAEAIRALTISGLNISAIFNVPLFAVGSATAKAARSIGFQNVFTGEGDGRALADLIVRSIEKSDLPSGPLVYLAGNPREGGLEETLHEARIAVKTVEVYEMRPVEWQRAEVAERLSPAPDAVLLYSKETARTFFSLMSDMTLSANLDNTRFIGISEKVLSAVPEAFRKAAFASEMPRETAMLDLLDRIAGT